MSFPLIDVDKPLGTYRVSTIDDYERETRRWLRSCMIEISGYPDVNTVTVSAWTNATRPNASPNGKYLLGYNTTEDIFEIIDPSGNHINILDKVISAREISLLVYPVGSYYETSDLNFDPNASWGGVWELVNDGRFLLATSSDHAINSTGGEETHTLTVNEMPKHDHKHNHQHSHTRGTMEIEGTFFSENNGYPDNVYSGAFYWEGSNNHRGIDGGDGDNSLSHFQASRNWTGETSVDDTQNSDAQVGRGQAHNNMPPFRVVNRWHRTA